MTGEWVAHRGSDPRDCASGALSDYVECCCVGVQWAVVVHGYDRHVSTASSDHGESWIVGVHHHNRGYTGGDRGSREPVVGDHQVDCPRLPQYIPHGLGVVGVEQAGPIAEGGYRLRPVQGYSSLVAPARLGREHVTAQLSRPAGEPEIVEDHSPGMPGGEEQSPTRGGDGSYPLPGFDKPLGRALRVDAPTSRILLPVRRVADLMGNGIVGLPEANTLQ